MAKPLPPRDEKGRWVRRGGYGLGAAIVAVAVAAGGGGLGAVGAGGGAAGGGASVSAGSGGSGSTGSSASRAGRGSRDARTARARDRSQERLLRSLTRPGRDVRRLDADATTDCAAVAYGQVRTFLAGMPCRAVGRALVEVRESGARVVVAVAAVELTGDDDARAFRRLVDTDGTGNVRELAAPRGVRWTGRHYRSAREGSTVVNAQAEPVGPTAAAARLAERVSRTAVGG